MATPRLSRGLGNLVPQTRRVLLPGASTLSSDARCSKQSAKPPHIRLEIYKGLLLKMNPTPSTFEYKRVKGVPICLDIFEPILATQSEQGLQVPAVVFFHGGGLTVGNRTNWFPTWLRGRSQLLSVSLHTYL